MSRKKADILAEEQAERRREYAREFLYAIITARDEPPGEFSQEQARQVIADVDCDLAVRYAETLLRRLEGKT